MAISAQDRARAAVLAKELNDIIGGRYRPDGSPKTFDELETQAGFVADLIASMAVNQSAQDLPEDQKCVRCPKCKAVPQKHDPDNDEPMIIQTTHGDVEWIAEGYYCRRCRRSFFPSAR